MVFFVYSLIELSPTSYGDGRVCSTWSFQEASLEIRLNFLVLKLHVHVLWQQGVFVADFFVAGVMQAYMRLLGSVFFVFSMKISKYLNISLFVLVTYIGVAKSVAPYF